MYCSSLKISSPLSNVCAVEHSHTLWSNSGYKKENRLLSKVVSSILARVLDGALQIVKLFLLSLVVLFDKFNRRSQMYFAL